MRIIKKTINLSDYKSFIGSLVPAVKDGVIIDPCDLKYQKRFNIRDNYKMCPVFAANSSHQFFYRHHSKRYNNAYTVGRTHL